MAGIDINRGTTGVVKLPSEVSQEIWAATSQQSVVQQLVPQVSLPGSGVSIPVVTGDPTAGWVNETDEKPVSASTFDTKIMTPYKLAVIELFSDEFARDHNALWTALIDRLPNALGKKFDETVFGFSAAPGDNFDTLASAPKIDIKTDPYAGYLNALGSVSAAGGDVTGWALSPAAEIGAMSAVDTAKRPLFITDVKSEGSIGSILARPVYKNNSVAKDTVIGFAGDWQNAAWGNVEGIQIDVNTTGSVTKDGQQINLWQRNMFAVRAEVEIGFRVRDTQRFAALTNGAAA